MFSKKRGKNLKIKKADKAISSSDSDKKTSFSTLDNIIKHSTNIFFETDVEGHFTFVSPQVESILGYTPEEFSMKWQEVTSENPKNEEAYNLIAESIESGKIQPSYEVEVVAKNGKKFWLEIKETPVVKDGRTIAFIGAATDITDKKNYLKKLEQSEQNYRLLVESQSELIIKFDLEGKIIFASKNYYDTFGVKPEQIIGKKFIPEIHQEDIDQVEPILKKAMHEPYNSSHSERMKTNQGWRWFSWRNRCIRKEDGTVEEIISVGRDITERKRSEEEINKLALIAKETSNAVIITDKEKNIEWVNEGFTRITGYKPEEVTGKKPGKILQGEKTDKNSIQKIRKALNNGIPIKTELLNYSKSGKEYWIEVNIQPIKDAKGKIIKYISIESDITERKDAEEALAKARKINDTLIEKANVVIVGLNSEGVIQLFNPTAEKVTGYKLEELKNKNWFEVLVPKERYPEVWEEFNRLMKGGMPEVFENPILTKKGEEKIITWSNNEINVDGEIIGTISFGIDITKRKRAEKDLMINEARLREAQRIANIGNWEWDVFGDKVWWSDQTYKIFGVDRSNTDIVYDTYLDFVVAEDKKHVESIVAEAVEKKQNFEIDCKIKSGDGVIKTINIQGKTFFDDENNSLRMAGTLQDITKRKAAEEALKFSEEKFSKAFFSAPDAIILATLNEGKVLEVNEGFEKIFEHSREEA